MTAKELLSRVGLLDPARNARRAARRALSRTLHPLRESVMRLPSPAFVVGADPLPSRYREHLAQLKRDGVTRLPDEIPAATLAELQRAFEEKFIGRLRTGGTSAASYHGDITVTDEYVDPQARMYASNEPFTISRALLEVCLKPELTSLIDHYLGKQAYITQGVALRLEPNPRTGFGSFQWHHDAWGKRINMMIILTEVGEGDQYMTYAKGSHRLRHSLEKYVDSRVSADEFARNYAQFEVLKCFARPGDIYIFDSNALHSGNRASGRVRDTFIIHYTRLSEAVWAHRVPAEFLAGFDDRQRERLKWMLEQDRSKRPLAPPVNSWVDGLLDVGKWIA